MAITVPAGVRRLRPVADPGPRAGLVARPDDRRDEIRHLSRAEPAPEWIVVAAEPITDIDTTAADMFEDLDEELNAKGISLVFAEMKTPVRTKIDRYKLTRTIDPAHFYPTVEDTVGAFHPRRGT
jgi:MFS superfamily sulfate permease-like transporter